SAAKIVHAFKAWLPRTSSCSRIRKVNAEKYIQRDQGQAKRLFIEASESGHEAAGEWLEKLEKRWFVGSYLESERETYSYLCIVNLAIQGDQRSALRMSLNYFRHQGRALFAAGGLKRLSQEWGHEWLSVAAGLGDSVAQLLVADFHAKGLWVKQSSLTAESWRRKVQRPRLRKAQLGLAKIFGSEDSLHAQIYRAVKSGVKSERKLGEALYKAFKKPSQ
ncbi:hypothetical protein, partial [Haloferula sp. A504]|uniref:hypothetical protein n=1 Tax=Haloferula sp. A504 TaxID=3373601 RepID=UPI0031C81ECB|nr:hypothetical protein [Verrucomicrobiaceae bacterium E54]